MTASGNNPATPSSISPAAAPTPPTPPTPTPPDAPEASETKQLTAKEQIEKKARMEFAQLNEKYRNYGDWQKVPEWHDANLASKKSGVKDDGACIKAANPPILLEEGTYKLKRQAIGTVKISKDGVFTIQGPSEHGSAFYSGPRFSVTKAYDEAVAMLKHNGAKVLELGWAEGKMISAGALNKLLAACEHHKVGAKLDSYLQEWLAGQPKKVQEQIENRLVKINKAHEANERIIAPELAVITVRELRDKINKEGSLNTISEAIQGIRDGLPPKGVLSEDCGNNLKKLVDSQKALSSDIDDLGNALARLPTTLDQDGQLSKKNAKEMIVECGRLGDEMRSVVNEVNNAILQEQQAIQAELQTFLAAPDTNNIEPERIDEVKERIKILEANTDVLLVLTQDDASKKSGMEDMKKQCVDLAGMVVAAEEAVSQKYAPPRSP